MGSGDFEQGYLIFVPQVSSFTSSFLVLFFVFVLYFPLLLLLLSEQGCLTGVFTYLHNPHFLTKLPDTLDLFATLRSTRFELLDSSIKPIFIIHSVTHDSQRSPEIQNGAPLSRTPGWTGLHHS